MSKELYRDTRNGKIGGVCAGIAQYFGIEPWIVRILVVSAALFSAGFLVMLAYFAGMLFLDKAPVEMYYRTEEKREHTVKSKPWQAGQSPSEVIKRVDKDMARMEEKIRRMEGYVTSSEYKVRREFRNL